MLSYLGRAVPLEDLTEGPSPTEEDLLFVQRVQNIRRFAMEDLGLEASRNYTRYVELDRNYLVAVVYASADDAFNRHQWWFPVVGRMPYKGFFNVEGARRERARLQRRNMDVWIGAVNAFSTLGWFRDPLYSFMKDYSEMRLADLIIHELVHATVWINGHAQFNEELAQFIGVEGSRLYMERIYGAAGFSAPELQAAAEEQRADRTAYNTFLRGLIAELDEMYKRDIPREEKLILKDEIILRAKIKFDDEYESLFITDNYRYLSNLEINNAYLSLFMLYHEEDHFFRELYQNSGSDLRQFINAAKNLSGRPPQSYNPKQEFQRALGL